MPFKSEAQERFLFAKHPDVAAKFLHDAGQPKNLPQHVGGKPPAPHPRGGSPWMHMGSSEIKPPTAPNPYTKKGSY